MPQEIARAALEHRDPAALHMVDPNQIHPLLPPAHDRLSQLRLHGLEPERERVELLDVHCDLEAG
jgi:hypothetical protein